MILMDTGTKCVYVQSIGSIVGYETEWNAKGDGEETAALSFVDVWSDGGFVPVYAIARRRYKDGTMTRVRTGAGVVDCGHGQSLLSRRGQALRVDWVRVDDELFHEHGDPLDTDANLYVPTPCATVLMVEAANAVGRVAPVPVHILNASGKTAAVYLQGMLCAGAAPNAETDKLAAATFWLLCKKAGLHPYVDAGSRVRASAEPNREREQVVCKEQVPVSKEEYVYELHTATHRYGVGLSWRSRCTCGHLVAPGWQSLAEVGGENAKIMQWCTLFSFAALACYALLAATRLQ